MTLTTRKRLALLPLAASAWLLLSAGASAQTVPPDTDAGVQAAVSAISQSSLQNTIQTLAAMPTRSTLSPTGSAQAANWVAAQFNAISQSTGGRLQVALDTWTQPADSRLSAPVSMTNVIATLPGTATPERIVIISGHYDTRCSNVMNATGNAPGADDDASGVAVALEMARVMAGRRYPATIKFVAFTGEEQGLYGSTHFAQQMSSGGKNVIAMVNNDIVGSSHGQSGVYDTSQISVYAAPTNPAATAAQVSSQQSAGTDADTPARTLGRAILDADRRYVPGFGTALMYRMDRFLRGGDHQPFVQKGYAAVRLTEPNEDWRHQHQDVVVVNGVQYGDLPQFVDFSYLANVARVNAATIATQASAPTTPTNVVLTANLSPVTTLSWDYMADAAAYEVLWRVNNAPDWQGVQLVQGTQTVTLPLSKDGYLFAVRSVSTSGSRSLPGIPTAH